MYAAFMEPGNTSLHRYEAFRRLNQDIVALPVDSYEPKSRYLAALRYRFPVGPLTARINRDLLAMVQNEEPDVVWFDKPVDFSPETIQRVKDLGATTVCYNQDNPFGPRNDGCWLQFLRIFRMFDLHCLLRHIDVPRYTAWGLPFIKVLLSYDPLQHFPPPPGWSDADRTREVSYVGSPLEQRPAFLRALAERGLPLSIAGPRWEKAWPPALLQTYVTGGMMKDGAYRESLWKSKINMAFLTRMNEEDVAHKSFEITACAQFLLAERSPGHLACFEEGREAEFYDSLDECAEKARYYLQHAAEREAIAAAGRARSLRSGYDNDSQLARVLWKLDGVEVGDEAGPAASYPGLHPSFQPGLGSSPAGSRP